MRNRLHGWECSSVQDDTCLWQERNLATHKNTWLSLSSSHLHHTLFVTLIFYWKSLKSRSFQYHCGMFLHMPTFQTKCTRSCLKDHMLLLATCFNLWRLMMPCLHACVLIFTLHPCGSKLLTSEKDGVIMVFFIVSVLPLLFESPATHILQTLRRIAQLNEARGLKAYMRRTLHSKLHFDFRNWHLVKVWINYWNLN